MKPDYTSLEFPAPPLSRPYVIVNMVMSADGRTILGGSEQGIGSKVDQRLMRELRVNADAVLNGANTLRASGTSSRLGDEGLEELRIANGKPRFPIAVGLSRSGKLPLDKIFFTARDFDAVVYLSEEAPADRKAALVATGRPVHIVPAGAEITAMLKHMRQDLDVKVLLVEGGPTVNAQMYELGVVDEYFLTLGPVIVGGRDTLTAVEGESAFSRDDVKHLELLAAVPNPETNEVYVHYRVRR